MVTEDNSQLWMQLQISLSVGFSLLKPHILQKMSLCFTPPYLDPLLTESLCVYSLLDSNFHLLVFCFLSKIDFIIYLI